MGLQQIVGQSGNSFVPPQGRREIVAALAAGFAAGAVAAPEPANAIKFSFFGFGDGSSQSDAYATLDPDSVNPYSPFSNPEKATYVNADKAPYIAKKKEAIDKILVKYQEIPGFLAKKDYFNVRSALSLQGGYLRQAMEYVSCGDVNSKCDQASKEYIAVRDIFQDISDCGVLNRDKRPEEALVKFDSAMNKIQSW